MPTSDCEILFFAVGTSPRCHRFSSARTRQYFVSEKKQFPCKPDNFRNSQQVVAPSAQHIVPVRKTPKHKTQSGSIGASRLASGRPKEVITKCPENIKLCLLL
jgi:hypothetical protein